MMSAKGNRFKAQPEEKPPRNPKIWATKTQGNKVMRGYECSYAVGNGNNDQRLNDRPEIIRVPQAE